LRRRSAVRGPITFLLVAGVLVAGACGGSDDGGTATTQPATTATTSSTPSSGTTATAAPGRTVAVEVRGGSVAGGARRVEADLGEEIRLVVRSDVADEVHLHGYDRRVDVDAGGEALLAFRADIPGVFEAELEERRLRLVTLQVR
jgi:hypothetical protein